MTEQRRSLARIEAIEVVALVVRDVRLVARDQVRREEDCALGILERPVGMVRGEFVAQRPFGRQLVRQARVAEALQHVGY